MVELNFDDGIRVVATGSRNGDFNPSLGLRNNSLAAGQGDGTNDLCRDDWQQKLVSRPFQDVNVNGPVAKRGHPVVAGEERPAARPVDAGAVFAEPVAHFAQSLHLRGINLTVGSGSDIQEQVAVASRGIDKIVDAVIQRFWPGGFLVSPGARKSEAMLPGMLVVEIPTRVIAFARMEIFRHVGAPGTINYFGM